MLAIFGYHWIHATQKWLMLLFLVTFGVFSVMALFVVPLEGVRDLANQVFPGSGTWLLIAALPGLISVITVNIYAAAMELITIADSIRPVTPTRSNRVLACIVIGAAAFVGNMLSTGSFLDSFGAFLVILLYILVPWT